MKHDVVFLDVDNTLLDNDRVADDLREYLTGQFGKAAASATGRIFEELGTSSAMPTISARCSATAPTSRTREPRTLLALSQFLVDYPFADRLYPDALEVLDQLGHAGPRSSSRTATSCSSRARCSGRACGKPSTDRC